MVESEAVIVDVKIEENEEASTEASVTKNNLAGFSKLEQDIIRQIEYYFSEPNLRRDKFLIGKVAETPEGWVDISVLLTFNRLKSITEDAKVVADTMRKSPNGTVEVNEDGSKVRRHPDNPLPEFNETRRKELQARTAYAKGFPLDSQLATLLEYFHSSFDNVEQVQMRKYFDTVKKVHLFKGSVFIIFNSREAAEAFVSKPDVKFNEKALLRYMQAKYFEVKKEEQKKGDTRRKAKKQAANGEEKADEKQAEFKLPKNAVLHFIKESDEGELSREDIKEKLAKVEPSTEIAYINFQKGESEGDIRFSKEDDATKMFEKLGKEKVRNFT